MNINIKEEISDIKKQIRELEAEKRNYEPDDSDFAAIQWEINWNESILDSFRALVQNISRRL